MYKVLLVDDEALVREAISANMKWNELGYNLIGTCKNGKEAIAFLKEHSVDLLITDICMPFVDGLDLSKHVYESYPDTRVIIISGYNEFEYAKKAVKYQVVEYVLKPVTVAELNTILLKVKETLQEENSKKESIKKLTGAYIKNLPIIRTRYLNQIVNGIIKEQVEDEIHDKLRELNISIQSHLYKVAIVVVEKSEEFLKLTPEAKKDLPTFILFNILEEMLEPEDNTIVFQDINSNTVIILGDEAEADQNSRISHIYEKCKDMVESHFGLGITFGVGHKMNSLSKVHKSYSSALSALEYRFLYGDNKILDIRDFGGMDLVKKVDISDDIKKLALFVKINNKQEISTILSDIMKSLKKYHISQSRIFIYVQNIVVEINNLLESANLTEDSFTQRHEELLQMLYEEKTLEDVEKSIRDYCFYMGSILSEQRDSFGQKQAIIAKEYIKKNYSNTELSLQTICNDLSISMSYFSSIFKKYTGETFIEALTNKRMKKSKELLRNTSMKIYEVAELVGFSDPHYFAITFKKHTGMTPKEYAKKERRSES